MGKFYMVPVIDAVNYCGISGPLPVIGPRHTDHDHFNFPYPHYHIDTRFLTARERSKVASFFGAGDANYTAGRMTLSNMHGSIPTGMPGLAKRKCTSVDQHYYHGHEGAVQALRASYPDAQAIVRPDGRLLCPHRKADLSQMAPDADGRVTCPLHGLQVCVRARAAIAAATGGAA